MTVNALKFPSLGGAERKEKPSGLFSEEPACREEVVVELGVGFYDQNDNNRDSNRRNGSCCHERRYMSA
jgi:hypothetical protein